MHVVGELRDKGMVDEILEELHQRGIKATFQYNSEHDFYIVFVENEDQFKEAHDLYRLKLGFSKAVEVDEQWIKIKKLPAGPLTLGLIFFCVAIYLSSFTPLGVPVYNSFLIGHIEQALFNEISSGQLWRLLTPIFLHMSILHILFNMLWLKDLGYILENNFSKTFFIGLILFSGILSNVAQYLVSGPEFGGMSGVLYAFLGFLWIYKKCNDDFQYALPKADTAMMIAWYFLCLTGLIGPIANTAHGAGLSAGMLVAVFYRWQKSWKRFLYFLLGLFFLFFTIAIEGYKLGGNYYYNFWANNG